MPRKCASKWFCVFKKRHKKKDSCIMITATKHKQMDKRCFSTVGPSDKRLTWWEATHLLKPCFQKHVLDISMQVIHWPRTTLLFWPLVLDFVFWHWSWDRGVCVHPCMSWCRHLALFSGTLLKRNFQNKFGLGQSDWNISCAQFTCISCALKEK